LLLFAELDDWKRTDEDFGRQDGDQAVIQTAETLRQTFRDSDVLARLEEGKFGALLIDTSKPLPKS
jgi:GGDEF domain-containing protein